RRAGSSPALRAAVAQAVLMAPPSFVQPLRPKLPAANRQRSQRQAKRRETIAAIRELFPKVCRWRPSWLVRFTFRSGRHDGRGQKGGNADAKLPQHERLSEREQLKRAEEKHGDREN